MKKTLITLAVAGGLGLAAPAVAGAADTTPTTPSAQQQCRTERDQMGVEVFRATYGTNHNKRNAFGKCVSERKHATKQARKAARSSAAQSCTAEQAADPAAFALKYGKSGKHGNKDKQAHRRCISQQAGAKTAATVDQQVTADVNAAQSCKTERDADPAAFEAKYGTNHSKRNAFGKCVSAQAKQPATQS